MSDLIDREKLIADIRLSESVADNITTVPNPIEKALVRAVVDAIVTCIKSQPAIQQERTVEKVEEVDGTLCCRNCGVGGLHVADKYCFNCGARFKEDQDGR